MFTDRIVEYGKLASHIVLECTYPRNATIATISGTVGWVASQQGLTEFPGWTQNKVISPVQGVVATPFHYLGNAFSYVDNYFGVDFLEAGTKKAGDILGYQTGRVSSWFLVPKATTMAAEYWGIGWAMATSFTLNMVALAIFGPKKGDYVKHSLPEILQRFGLASKPKIENAPDVPAKPSLNPAATATVAKLPVAKDTVVPRDPSVTPNIASETQQAPKQPEAEQNKANTISAEESEDMFDDDPLMNRQGCCDFFC